MLKSIQTLVFAALMVVVAVSCKTSDNDVREAARQNVTGGVQSTDPAAATAPGITPGATVAPPPPAAAVPTGPSTTMTFAESTFDFGTVQDGEMVAHTYTFTNTGKEPLILSNAQGTCGCTVPKWPREPIAPGAKGQITVEFNSKGKVGKRDQKVTITANTNPPQSFIHLTGEVVAGANGTPAVNQ